MNVDERLADDQAEPHIKRLAVLPREVRQPLGGIEECLLQNVVRVDATVQATVEPDMDHPPEALAVAGEQLREPPGSVWSTPINSNSSRSPLCDIPRSPRAGVQT